MHRARHAGASPTLRRPRTLILLAVATLGLAAALWLPGRNDTASASENGRDRQQSWSGHHHGDRWNWWRHHHHRPFPPIPVPTGSRSAEPPTIDPPSDPTTEPTTEPTTAAPTVSPTPTDTAPAATAWKPFTDYTAGQVVSFAGKVYQVQQPHTSLPGWEPPKLPALFTLV
jgi:hypothetical protein